MEQQLGVIVLLVLLLLFVLLVGCLVATRPKEKKVVHNKYSTSTASWAAYTIHNFVSNYNKEWNPISC